MRNNKGLTIIELILASSIGIAVVLLAGSLIVFGFRSLFINSDMASEQNALRITALRVTQDLHRVSDPELVFCGENSITIGIDDDSVEYVYNAVKNEITRNGETIAQKIAGFLAGRNGKTVSVSIVSEKFGLELSSSVELR